MMRERIGIKHFIYTDGVSTTFKFIINA